jgi:hypothetical protein
MMRSATSTSFMFCSWLSCRRMSKHADLHYGWRVLRPPCLGAEVICPHDGLFERCLPTGAFLEGHLQDVERVGQFGSASQGFVFTTSLHEQNACGV